MLENRRLRALAGTIDGEDPLIGASTAMQRLRLAIGQLAAANVDVLVEGEAGTGKDLVATMLHRRGPRRARPFVVVDCARLTDETGEAELFGHAADSVAHTRLARVGQAVTSSGGTLLLDDVDATPLSLQSGLRKMIEEREVRPIGAERPHAVDLHVVATSKVDLDEAVAAGRFRADLHHRLNATRLRVPPLRERNDDALALFGLFAEDARLKFGIDGGETDAVLLAYLRAHAWPGNVRELRSYAWDAVLGGARGSKTDSGTPRDLPARVAAFEGSVIETALRTHRGNVAKALATLGIPRKTLYDKMARHGLSPSNFRDGH